MKEDVKKAVEYELLVRSKIGNSMIPIGIGLMIFLAGIVAMIPIEMKDGAIYIYYSILVLGAVECYLRMFLLAVEDTKAVNVFMKYRMVPVKKEFLIQGKVWLLTRFVIRSTIVFQLLNLVIRLLAGAEILCIEAALPTLIMLVVYGFELFELYRFSKKLNRSCNRRKQR